MNDNNATIDDLIELAKQFVAERDWGKYHNPKDLSMAIAIEAGELMQATLWLSPATADMITSSSRKGMYIREELADILIYCLLLADKLNVDISETVAEKIRKNAKKYPASKYRGEYRRPSSG